MSEARLIELESRLAWQEAALRELSDVIAAQQKQINGLEQACRKLAERLANAAPGSQRGSAEDEIPPHY